MRPLALVLVITMCLPVAAAQAQTIEFQDIGRFGLWELLEELGTEGIRQGISPGPSSTNSVGTDDLPGLTIAELTEQLRPYGAVTAFAQSDGLPSESQLRQQAIVQAFRKFGDDGVLALAAALDDLDVHLRRNAAGVLKLLPGNHGEFDMKGRIHDVDPKTDISIAIPALVQRLADADRGVRASAARALAEMTAGAAIIAVPALVRLLDDPVEFVRMAACDAIDMGVHPADPESVPRATARGFGAPSVQTNRMFVTPENPSQLSLPRIIEHLQRADSVAAKGAIGPSNPTDRQSEAFATALRQHGGKAFIALATALGDRDVNVRRNSARAFTWLVADNHARDPRHIEMELAMWALTDRLTDPDATVRNTSAQVLPAFGPIAVSAVLPLADLLDSDSRLVAYSALAAFGPVASAALRVLLPFLQDPAPDMRGCAQRAIEAIAVR